jgi:FixJ family two-component response regulator
MNRHTAEEPLMQGDTQATPTVFVVDPDASVHRSVGSLIRREGWRDQILTSAEEFIVKCHPPGPSCLVCEITLPGSSGLELQEHLAGRPDIPIIFLANHCDIPTTVTAMRAGAVECLIKPFRDDMLLIAIRCALELSRAVIPLQAELRMLRERYASLSCREREVMALVVAGLLNKQVAGRLGISEITVKAHRGRVMRKMGVGSFAQLVVIAANLEAVALSQASPRLGAARHTLLTQELSHSGNRVLRVPGLESGGRSGRHFVTEPDFERQATEAEFHCALALAPNDCAVKFSIGQQLATSGEANQAIKLARPASHRAAARELV